MLIICDWTSEEFLPGTPVTVLRDALTKWDGGAVLKNPPYLLKGGYQKFLSAFPHEVTRSTKPSTNPDQTGDEFNDARCADASSIKLKKLFEEMAVEYKKLAGHKKQLHEELKKMKKERLEEEESLEKAKQDVIPECPVCLEEMGPGVAIWQCGAGHLACGGCRGRVQVCGECRQGGYSSRSRRLEQYRDKIMQILDIAAG